MNALALARLANSPNVGFSTGIYDSLRGQWPALLAKVRVHNERVGELSALSATELPSLVEYLQIHPLPPIAQYAIHAPSKHLPASGLLVVADHLRSLSTFTSRLVIHPDTIGDGMQVLQELGDRIVIENMDGRKFLGSDVSSLHSLFSQLPKARFCLDVAHAWSVDPSMRLAHQLLDTFSDRLVQLHLSGIDAEGRHRPLTLTQLDAYRPLLERVPFLPWILESVLA